MDKREKIFVGTLLFIAVSGMAILLVVGAEPSEIREALRAAGARGAW